MVKRPCPIRIKYDPLQSFPAIYFPKIWYSSFFFMTVDLPMERIWMFADDSVERHATFKCNAKEDD